MPPLIPQLFYIISDAPQVQPVNSIWGGVGGGGGGKIAPPSTFFKFLQKYLVLWTPSFSTFSFYLLSSLVAILVVIANVLAEF